MADEMKHKITTETDIQYFDPGPRWRVVIYIDGDKEIFCGEWNEGYPGQYAEGNETEEVMDKFTKRLREVLQPAEEAVGVSQHR
jgi:hypothetical protein